MKTNHTPGPWHLIPRRNGYLLAAFSGDETEQIAEIFPKPSEEQEANARLIASTPDLLAALQTLEALIGASADVLEAGGVGFLPEWEQARAAIAKATTPQP